MGAAVERTQAPLGWHPGIIVSGILDGHWHSGEVSAALNDDIDRRLGTAHVWGLRRLNIDTLHRAPRGRLTPGTPGGVGRQRPWAAINGASSYGH